MSKNKYYPTKDGVFKGMKIECGVCGQTGRRREMCYQDGRLVHRIPCKDEAGCRVGTPSTSSGATTYPVYTATVSTPVVAVSASGTHDKVVTWAACTSTPAAGSEDVTYTAHRYLVYEGDGTNTWIVGATSGLSFTRTGAQDEPTAREYSVIAVDNYQNESAESTPVT